MENFLQLYTKNPLFYGIEESDLLSLLDCLQAQKRSYTKGSIICSASDKVNQLGIVLFGRINTVYDDLLGGRSIIGTMGEGELVCDAFACSKSGIMPVSVVAQTDSSLLFINVNSILHTCAAACRRHSQLSENLVHILADKYTALNAKVIHLSARTTRRKLLSYLSEQMRLGKGKPFNIPFTQQELADYLFIERSGLSTEWNKLKNEGIIKALSNDTYLLKISPCLGSDCADK